MMSRMSQSILPLLACVAGLASGAGPAAASPPIPSDVALILTVHAGAPALRPGVTGELRLRVENRYPRAYPFILLTRGTPVPAGSPPIRLFSLPDSPDDDCHLQQIDDNPNVTGRYWQMGGHLAIGAAVTCRIGFGILPAGATPGRLEFEARAYTGLSAGYIDLSPGDNLAVLPFGQTVAHPVPTLRRTAVAVSLLVLLLSGLLILRRDRRS